MFSLIACCKEIVFVLTACRKKAKAGFPLPLTALAVLSNRLAASRNYEHPRTANSTSGTGGALRGRARRNGAILLQRRLAGRGLRALAEGEVALPRVTSKRPRMT